MKTRHLMMMMAAALIAGCSENEVTMTTLNRIGYRFQSVHGSTEQRNGDNDGRDPEIEPGIRGMRLQDDC